MGVLPVLHPNFWKAGRKGDGVPVCGVLFYPYAGPPPRRSLASRRCGDHGPVKAKEMLAGTPASAELVTTHSEGWSPALKHRYRLSGGMGSTLGCAPGAIAGCSPAKARSAVLLIARKRTDGGGAAHRPVFMPPVLIPAIKHRAKTLKHQVRTIRKNGLHSGPFFSKRNPE